MDDSKLIWILVGAAAVWLLMSLSKKNSGNGSQLVQDPVSGGKIDSSLIELPHPPPYEGGVRSEALAGDDWRNAQDPGVALCKKLYGYCGAPTADQVYRVRR